MRKLIVLLSLLALTFAVPQQSAFCSLKEKMAGACFKIMNPVCAIQIKAGFSGRVDFDNRCLACKDAYTDFVLDGTCDSFSQDANFCRPIPHGEFACFDIYEPVCAYFKQHVQCLVAPCAATISNACYACNNQDVAYYLPGACEGSDVNDEKV